MLVDYEVVIPPAPKVKKPSEWEIFMLEEKKKMERHVRTVEHAVESNAKTKGVKIRENKWELKRLGGLINNFIFDLDEREQQIKVQEEYINWLEIALGYVERNEPIPVRHEVLPSRNEARIPNDVDIEAGPSSYTGPETLES